MCNGYKLEQYTLKHPQEVLVVTIEIEDNLNEIMIYKGFSSSLSGQTAFDPDVSVIPPGSKIVNIDRVKAPYIPSAPNYIQRGISWEEWEILE